MRIEDDERVVAIEPINEGQNDATLEGTSEDAVEEGARSGESLPPPATEGDEPGPDDGGQQDA